MCKIFILKQKYGCDFNEISYIIYNFISFVYLIFIC